MRRSSAVMTRSPSAADGRVQGHPLIWAVVGQRLYLFYSEQTRASFLADPGRIIDTAERKWPDVRDLGNSKPAQRPVAADFLASPQAMKAGTRKFSAARPKPGAGLAEFVTLPPAATTSA